jgi:hypothetical protein
MRRLFGCSVLLSGVLSACASGASPSAVTALPIDAAQMPDQDSGALPEDTQTEDSGISTPVDVETDAGTCGDSVCDASESCSDCSPDCGRCPLCELAPSCSGSVAIPTSTVQLTSFDNGERRIYTSGVEQKTGKSLGTPLDQTDCIAPELRLRVRQINVVRDGVSFGSANLYCIVSASDGAHSEVMITPLQRNVGDDNPPLIFQPEASLFWGQGKPWQTLNNLTVTYQCFRAVSNESYTKVFDALQSGANSAGGIAGPWGWAFGVGSMAAGLISAAVPEGNDELRVNVQQTIDDSMLLDLTNGRRWQIRGTGDAPGVGGLWDWRLEVETWGCSDARLTIK